MTRLRDMVGSIAREEACSYLEHMMTLEEVNASRIEAKPRLSLRGRKPPWEMSKCLGRSPRPEPYLFAGLLGNALRRRGYRFRVFQQGCSGKDVRPVRGRVKHGYDLVYGLIDHAPLEFRLHLRSLGEAEPSKTYLIARNIELGLEDDIQAVLFEVKEAAARARPLPG